MYSLKAIKIIAVSILVASPVTVSAQTCGSLRAELNASGFELAGIAVDYPLTHASIVVCLANNEREEDAFACVVGVVALACAAMGSEYCSDLTSRWARAGQNYWWIASRMRQLGCRI